MSLICCEEMAVKFDFSIAKLIMAMLTLSKRFKRIIRDREINTTTKISLFIKLRRICARQNRPVSCRSATIGEILQMQ